MSTPATTDVEQPARSYVKAWDESDPAALRAAVAGPFSPDVQDQASSSQE
jgi:hypothetical protein